MHKIMNREIEENFQITQDGVLTMIGRVCVLNIDNLRRVIMEEAYYSAYMLCIWVVPKCIELSRKIIGTLV